MVNVIVNRAGIQGPSPDTSCFLKNEYILRFDCPLNSGQQCQYIKYPTQLSEKPVSIICDFINDADNICYSWSLSNINTSGFNISFSDELSNNQYILHTVVCSN